MPVAHFKSFKIDYTVDAPVGEGWTLTPDNEAPENISHDRVGMVRTRTFQPKADIVITAKGTVTSERSFVQQLEVGFVQFVMKTKRVLTYQDKTKYKVKIPGCPRRDGGKDRQNPWYSPVGGKAQLAVSRTTEGRFDIKMSDCPRFPVPLEYRPDGQQVRDATPMTGFDEVEFREAFSTFLVARKGTEIAWLHRIDWEVLIVGKVNPLQIPSDHGARRTSNVEIEKPTDTPTGIDLMYLSGGAAHLSRTIGIK